MNQYQKKIAAQIPIKQSAIEGESAILSVYCIKESFLKKLLYFIFCIATLGLGWIIAFWAPRYKRKFLYSYSTVNLCTHFLVLNWDLEWTIVKKIPIFVENQIQFNSFLQRAGFENRYLRYYYDDVSHQISCNEFPINNYISQSRKLAKMGIQNDILYRQGYKAYGTCEISITVPHTLQIIMNEFLHPFFLFQLYSIILWFYEGYIYFTTVLVLMTLYSLIIDVIVARENYLKIRKMAYYNSMVYEYAIFDPLGPFRRVPTKSLIPGTIIYVNENFQLPCDCILLEGECLVDEASLTGESIPVPKSKASGNLDYSKKNILFDGTTILQTSQFSVQGLPCLVIRTGFQSVRGQLIRSILYPKPHKFNFFQESINFMFILCIITIIGILILIPILIKTGQLDLKGLMLTFSDSFTITIPPTLPAAMSFGVSFALERLRKNGVYCISPPKIIMSGRIDTVCFDKTGTLTQSGMTIKQIIGENLDELKDCMLCCQTLIKVRKEIQIKVKNDKHLQESEVLGDPMERSMLEFIEGDILETTDQYIQLVARNEKYGILKRFDFTSDSQSMSVIAQNLNTMQVFLFTKGAPEAIKFKEIPQKYQQILEQETKQGSRVIALGKKRLFNYINNNGNEINDGFEFLGFCFIKNSLKEQSAKTIEELKQAMIDVKIVTGDNIFTAISVAEQSNFFRKYQRIGIFRMNEKNKRRQIQYKEFLSLKEMNTNVFCNQFEISFEEGQVQLFLQIKLILQDKLTNELIQILKEIKDIQFCMTGKVFEVIFPQTILYNDFLRSLLINTVVFGRMKPHHKTNLIELLQINKKTVCMVGDGANDCGALKQADAGLALTESEASISAPFTSKIMNISAVLILIRNGRAALATNFQCFKFMALYSLIQFVSMIVLYFTFSQMSDMQYLYVDLFIICPIFMTMALTEPYQQLSIERPSSSLFSAQCLLSVAGQVVMQTLAQVILILILVKQEFYQGVDSNLEVYEDEEDYVIESPDSTSIFVLCNFLYVASIMAFSISKPFRKPFYSNVFFTSNIIAIWVLNILLTFFKWIRLPNLEFDDNTPQEWLGFVVIYAHAWSLIFYIYENIFCVKIFIWWQRRKKGYFQQEF